MGVPARKLAAASGRVSPFYVGLAPCTTSNAEPGVNGVTAADLRWVPQPLNATAVGVPNGSVALQHVASGRCLATRAYLKGPTIVPVLLPCNTSDATQAWLLPQPLSVTHVINVAMNLSLAAVSAFTVIVPLLVLCNTSPSLSRVRRQSGGRLTTAITSRCSTQRTAVSPQPRRSSRHSLVSTRFPRRSHQSDVRAEHL